MGSGHTTMKLGMPMLATTIPYHWQHDRHARSVYDPALTTARMDSQWVVDIGNGYPFSIVVWSMLDDDVG